jgi:hypothetical protein
MVRLFVVEEKPVRNRLINVNQSHHRMLFNHFVNEDMRLFWYP